MVSHSSNKHFNRILVFLATSMLHSINSCFWSQHLSAENVFRKFNVNLISQFFIQNNTVFKYYGFFQEKEFSQENSLHD